MEQELLTPKELASKLKVTTACIHNWVKAGLPQEIKKPPRFLLDNVKMWLEIRSEK